MKKIFGKPFKYLILAFLSLFLVQNFAFSYETVLVDFPNTGWHKVFYEKRAKEAIAQFVPSGQSRQHYYESLIFHSYKWAYNKNMTSESLMIGLLNQASLKYRDIQKSIIKTEDIDSIAIWCSGLSSQCEIIRVTKGFEGLISMHYINRNPQLFQNIYPNWVDIIKHIRVYYSYYRWDRVMGKEDSVEL